MSINIKITRPIYIRSGAGKSYKSLGVINPGNDTITMDGVEDGESWKGLGRWYYKYNDEGIKQYYWEGGTNTVSKLHWSLRLLGIDKLWNVTKGDDVKIAIIDSGIDINNSDLFPFIGYNVLDKTENVKDIFYHGTYCAAIAKSRGNFGVYGVAPNSTLIPIKVQNNDIAEPQDQVAGIKKAIELGADIISISYGRTEENTSISEVLKLAMDRGIICIAAAGNNRGSTVQYPANTKGMISVGSVACSDPDLNHPIFIKSLKSAGGLQSENKEGVTIVAPGDGLITYDEFGKIVSHIKGTSYAAPFVAGIAALWLSQAKKKENTYGNAHQEFRSIITRTATKNIVPFEQNFLGAGLINPESIINL